MKHEGPVLETLTRRLAECPPEFLAEPRMGAYGDIEVAAVVSDLMEDLGGPPLAADAAKRFNATTSPEERNRLRAVLVASWLLHDPWFRPRSFAGHALGFLAVDLTDLAQVVAAEKLVTDPDGREELARLALSALELRPAGETIEQAQDRLNTLSSVERDRVIREARAAEERASQIREAMRKKAAEEAALRYGRE